MGGKAKIRFTGSDNEAVTDFGVNRPIDSYAPDPDSADWCHTARYTLGAP